MSCGNEGWSVTECDEVLHELDHYLHGELDQERVAHLEEHLGDCGWCFEHAEFQRKLKEIVRVKCRTETPEHLVLRVRETIRFERERPRSDL